MTLPAFDTHAYVKRLKKAGFNEEQAEAQAELQAQVLSNLVTEKLATKDDIMELKKDNLRLEHTLREDMTRLEHKFEQEFIRIAGKFSTLNWMVGFMLTGMATILFKLFLHG
jgi:hypothetical protein